MIINNFILSFIHFIFQAQVVSGKRPLNYVEMTLFALGVVVVILQVVGFITVRRRLANAAPVTTV